MDIWDVDKLILFLIFVIPGFISMKTFELLNPTDVKDSSKQIIDAIAYSSIIYAIFSIPIYLIESSDKPQVPVLYYGFYFFVVALFPPLLSCIWTFARKTKILQKFIPHPTKRPWDFFFSKRPYCWVIITTKDGKKIGGVYDKNSFTSAYPTGEQIYLEEHWLLKDNGAFKCARPNTKGILVLGSEIATIEFINFKEEDVTDEQRQTEQQ